MSSIDKIHELFTESIRVKQQCLAHDLGCLVKMGTKIVKSIETGGKLMICGNGGSASDAQHLAAEMLVRLKPQNNRNSIPVISLALDTSTLTACGNDFGFEFLFERSLKALGKPEDILLVISTSGNPKNINNAAKAANEMGIPVFGFLGSDGGKVLDWCDEYFMVPSSTTGRIQEAHITAGHALMEMIEEKLLENQFVNLWKSK
ncbi:MAG: hypothetical protein CBC25_04475 [Pelagibacteraceae bacterium TMED65]|nr:MAG: hypothetical protein CBC25_04475 [Pelagibacteraceae bacterium TMED65]